MIGNFGERIKTVFRQYHLATGLQQENLGTAADGVAVVNHRDLEAHQVAAFHLISSGLCTNWFERWFTACLENAKIK